MNVQPEIRVTMERPPVVETVLSAQFAPIDGLTAAHVGWYWKEFLDASWARVQESPALEDQFERFDRPFSGALLQLTAFNIPPFRIQICNEEGDRVIQIQNTRFVYNWRRRGGDYPSFETILDEFADLLDGFRGFLNRAGLRDIEPNQWELTYVDHVPKGELWQESGDFHKIFPGLHAPPTHPDAVRLESASSERRFEIVPQLGRIHMVSRHARTPEDADVLALQTTARGPTGAEGPESAFVTGLRIGHGAVVQTFLAAASTAALKHWGLNR